MSWLFLLALGLLLLSALEYLHERAKERAADAVTKREELKDRVLYLRRR